MNVQLHFGHCPDVRLKRHRYCPSDLESMALAGSKCFGQAPRRIFNFHQSSELMPDYGRAQGDQAPSPSHDMLPARAHMPARPMREEIGMKAVRIHETGGPDLLQVEEMLLPEPGKGQVRVEV